MDSREDAYRIIRIVTSSGLGLTDFYLAYTYHILFFLLSMQQPHLVNLIDVMCLILGERLVTKKKKKNTETALYY